MCEQDDLVVGKRGRKGGGKDEVKGREGGCEIGSL